MTKAALLLGLLLAAGCELRAEDFSSVRADAKAFHDGWSSRASDLATRHAALLQRAQDLPAETPQLPDLLNALTALRAQIDGVPAQIAAVRDDAFAKIEDKRRRLAEESLARGASQVAAALDPIAAQLTDLEARLSVLEQERAARAAEPPPAPPPPPSAGITDPAFATRPGSATLAGIQFRAGSVSPDTAASAGPLGELVALAGRCPELRLAVAVVPDEGEARLATARAQAVANYVRRQARVSADAIRVMPPRADAEPGLIVEVVTPCAAAPTAAPPT